ncbi:MAG TPA: sigma-54 dependent transcriptional regulator [Candidatus Deferrimicrobium sp.]|nr:sigma-54 dependent transcriptional regulator [Candidatus Deferrimicrobium sp.]
MANILIIDDDEMICGWISKAVNRIGQNPTCVHTLGEGLKKAEHHQFDVIFLETRMPDGSGLDIMPKIKTFGYAPEIIIISGNGDPDEAERAIMGGAWDYIEKPALGESIEHHLTRVLEYRTRRGAGGTGKPALALNRKDIIGSSQRLDASFELLAQAAQSDVNVLITGETGTGKELFARAIHYNSHRANRNFVIVDCTALPETLIESVLFGHTRGSFTGAYTSQDGLIRQADRGTLFLDEVGEMPLTIQKSFLRVIQEHRFRPLGGNQEVTSDFRLVGATNRDLENMVRQGQFREDLLFRLRTLVIELPPLRECLDDIKELTLHFVSAYCERFGIGPKGFSHEFWDVMLKYKWPGNVRELIQSVEKALLSAKDEPILFPKHLPTHIRVQVARNSVLKKSINREPMPASLKSGVPIIPTLPTLPAVGQKLPKFKDIRKAAVFEGEQRYLKNLLVFVNGSIDEACRVSGLSRSRLYTLLKKYRLSPHD